MKPVQSNPARRTVPLGDVSEIVSGITLGRRAHAVEGRQVPYLRVANVKDGYLSLDDVYSIRATEQEIVELRLQRGDLLLTEGGDRDKLGRGTFWQEEFPECIHQNHIFRVRLDAHRFDPVFVTLMLRSEYGKSYFLAHAKQTTGIATINRQVLARFPLIELTLDAQRAIASALTAALDTADVARQAARDRVAAAEALPAAYLREVFESHPDNGWCSVELGSVVELLPSKSLANDGDASVKAITTACLTETGFSITGIKDARMHSSDVAHCLCQPGELLIARSNTPELVGRVSLFPGAADPLVATDLSIRIWPGDRVSPAFLTGYLSYLYLSGYWREKAGGASGSMKKITRGQLQALRVPLPDGPDTLDTQRAIAADLSAKLSAADRLIAVARAELAALDALPAALLRAAFGGAE